jgi:hypothetical protein
MRQSELDEEDEDDNEEIPFLLFRADGSNLSPWSRPFYNIDVPAGLYMDNICKHEAQDFGNMSSLLLPFGVGSKGYARDSTGSTPPIFAFDLPYIEYEYG